MSPALAGRFFTASTWEAQDLAYRKNFINKLLYEWVVSWWEKAARDYKNASNFMYKVYENKLKE